MRRTASLCTVVSVLAIGLVIADATPAYAAPTWKLSASPSPPEPKLGTSLGIACTSATACIAVGSASSTSPPTASIIRKTGSTWTSATVPLPAGNTGSQLQGTACATTTDCFAVGVYATLGGVAKTLIERWNGSAWSVVSSPNPVSAQYAILNAIACPTASQCFAVGTYNTGTGFKTLAERWNGSVWSIVSSPNTSGDNQLTGIACTSPINCFAVGAHGTLGASETLIERWNGLNWAIKASPNLPGSTVNNLRAVECVSGALCFAVGDRGSSHHSVIERWNGTTWSLVVHPHPAGWTSSAFQSIACASSSLCFATGSRTAGATTKTLIERWNGSAWTVGPSPNPSSSSNNLYGASCPTTNSCFAVGMFGSSHQLLERWNGASWSIGLPPVNSSLSGLSGLACRSATSCFAVGTRNANEASRTLVERWNGSHWTITPSPNVPGTTVSLLRAVACPAANTCFAVGVSATNFTSKTLIERWNGASWSIVPSPNPPGSSASLSGVACPGALSCYAVGEYNSGSPRTLIEHWNGSGWSIVPTPGLTSQLTAISCPSTSRCFATGHNAAGGRVTRWNGSTWAGVAVPKPIGTVTELHGISCAGTSFCVATGTAHFGGGINRTLAIRWNGTNWAVMTSINPIFSTDATLDGVSCLSNNYCVAVGQSQVGDEPIAAIIERWNGAKWTFMSHPNPAGAIAASLEAVKCTATTKCAAVGHFFKSGTVFTHAQRYS